MGDVRLRRRCGRGAPWREAGLADGQEGCIIAPMTDAEIAALCGFLAEARLAGASESALLQGFCERARPDEHKEYLARMLAGGRVEFDPELPLPINLYRQKKPKESCRRMLTKRTENF